MDTKVPLKVLITGSRTWDDSVTIFEALEELPDGCEFIIGDAPGADKIAASIVKKEYGKSRNWRLYKDKQFKADWNRYGHAAGPIRNYDMIKEEPDLVRVFRDKGRSPGTDHMHDLAAKYLRTEKHCYLVVWTWWYPSDHPLASIPALKVYNVSD